MTRVIGGSAGGRRLKTPPGDRTRPTSDRVREALFSALESEFGSLDDLAVLDLFAGSGAIAIEAMSRGAAKATAVESDRRTAQLIESNARSVGLQVGVRSMPVARFLAGAPTPTDIAFADPPYPLGEDELAAVLAALAPWLVDDAVIVVERGSRSPQPTVPAGWHLIRERDYGETTLWYFHADLGEGSLA